MIAQSFGNVFFLPKLFSACHEDAVRGWVCGMQNALNPCSMGILYSKTEEWQWFIFGEVLVRTQR